MLSMSIHTQGKVKREIIEPKPFHLNYNCDSGLVNMKTGAGRGAGGVRVGVS
jgi:hypothetical protein